MLAALVAPADGARTPGPWLPGLRWVHSRPLEDADLAGRVVLVEFWAFDCINCRRTVPAMRRLEVEHRAEKDLVIIGVHTPELEEERDFGNLTRAVGRLGIRYPVAHDP